MPKIPWTFEDVKKALDDSRTPENLSKEMHRTADAIEQVRGMAIVYRNGKGAYFSTSIKNLFEKYFTNKGDMRLEEKTEPTKSTPVVETQTKVEDCESKMETLINKADEQFSALQETMAELARIQAGHATHQVTDELVELKRLHTEDEKKIQELTELAEKAKRAGFGSMLRGLNRF